MPTAEPHPRGAHLLDAAVTVIAERGFGSLSIRNVAAKSGVSPAQVQYYFHSKDELVDAAFSYVGEKFLARFHSLESEEPSWHRLRQAIWMWLPLDTERENTARVWLAFSTAAATNRRLGAASARLDNELRSWFADELENLSRSERFRAGVDSGRAATQLLALIDGVTLQSLVLPARKRRQLAEETIDTFLHDLTDTGDRRSSTRG